MRTATMRMRVGQHSSNSRRSSSRGQPACASGWTHLRRQQQQQVRELQQRLTGSLPRLLLGACSSRVRLTSVPRQQAHVCSQHRLAMVPDTAVAAAVVVPGQQQWQQQPQEARRATLRPCCWGLMGRS